MPPPWSCKTMSYTTAPSGYFPSCSSSCLALSRPGFLNLAPVVMVFPGSPWLWEAVPHIVRPFTASLISTHRYLPSSWAKNVYRRCQMPPALDRPRLRTPTQGCRFYFRQSSWHPQLSSTLCVNASVINTCLLSDAYWIDALSLMHQLFENKSWNETKWTMHRSSFGDGIIDSWKQVIVNSVDFPKRTQFLL